ncbi:MAG: hypothetical protein HC839_00760 [Leptolyngbyaceae cyanobacterium RM2_2_21]|nr:hypothetical protein [Leptolyngbyaceae cyanobacterium RM2_2_21]
MAPMIGSSAIEPVKTAGIVTVAADIRSFVFEAVFRKLQLPWPTSQVCP